MSGINIFLDGFVPTENLRFRETSLVFKVAETATEEEIKRLCRYDYVEMDKKLGKSFSVVYYIHTHMYMYTHYMYTYKLRHH